MRTFSKAWGLAGLRLGYIISSKRNIEILNKSLLRIAFKPSIINEGEIIEKIYTAASEQWNPQSHTPTLQMYPSVKMFA